MDKRKRIILVVCIIGVIVTGCCSTTVIPDNSGEIMETQSDLADDVATVIEQSGNLEDQASEISGTLAGLAQSNPDLIVIAGKAEVHAKDARVHAEANRELKKSVDKARMEVVRTLKRSAHVEGLYNTEKAERIRVEGQRNLAWVILCVIGIIVVAIGYLKIRGFL